MFLSTSDTCIWSFLHAALNLYTLDTGILIMVQQVRLMMLFGLIGSLNWLGLGLGQNKPKVFRHVHMFKHVQKVQVCILHILYTNENHDITIAMSSSGADPVLPWLGVFKCLYQSHCTDWGHLNV